MDRRAFIGTLAGDLLLAAGSTPTSITPVWCTTLLAERHADDLVERDRRPPPIPTGPRALYARPRPRESCSGLARSLMRI